MTTDLSSLPKPAKALPEDAQVAWVAEYNRDYAWRCSESHAEKAAWRVIRRSYEQTEDGAWAPRQ